MGLVNTIRSYLGRLFYRKTYNLQAKVTLFNGGGGNVKVFIIVRGTRGPDNIIHIGVVGLDHTQFYTGIGTLVFVVTMLNFGVVTRRVLRLQNCVTTRRLHFFNVTHRFGYFTHLVFGTVRGVGEGNFTIIYGNARRTGRNYKTGGNLALTSANPPHYNVQVANFGVGFTLYKVSLPTCNCK